MWKTCFAAVGRGELPSADVVKAVYPDYQDTRVTTQNNPAKAGEKGWFNIQNAAGMIFQGAGRRRGAAASADPAATTPKPGKRALPIRGTNPDLPVRFAPEAAVPGDRIVGILQPGAGITIYPIQSPALTAYDDQPERWIDVRWDIDDQMSERFPARISVIGNQLARLFGGNCPDCGGK